MLEARLEVKIRVWSSRKQQKSSDQATTPSILSLMKQNEFHEQGISWMKQEVKIVSKQFDKSGSGVVVSGGIRGKEFSCSCQCDLTNPPSLK